MPTRFRLHCCQPSSKPPDLMCPILNRMDHTNALVCTLEGASCFREETLPCQVAKPGLTIFLQSANGGTVMPTAARVLLGLNMLHSAHAPATSLQFVDGQELLSALWNSSPLFHLSSCLHGLTSYFTGCPCGFVFGFVWGWFCVCCFLGVFPFCLATWLVTRS